MKCAGSVKQKEEIEEFLLQKYLKKAFDDLSEFKCEFCNDEFRSDKTLKMHRLICKKKTEALKNNQEIVNPDKKDQKVQKDQNRSNVLVRKNDPIREFFEKEEKKKKEKTKKVKKIQGKQI